MFVRFDVSSSLGVRVGSVLEVEVVGLDRFENSWLGRGIEVVDVDGGGGVMVVLSRHEVVLEDERQLGLG